jgi:RNA-directed DNA polymerase
VLLDRADVLRWLGIDGEEGFRRLVRPGAGPGAPYVEFEIPKRSGGTRTICAPRAELKRVQRKILDELLARLPVHAACQAFVPGRSVVSNAGPHQGAALILKLDLVSFFPTIHYRRVEGFFLSLGYPREVAGMLAGLTTHRPCFAGGRVAWPGTMPQGAPTSPALANLLCERLDTRLTGLAAKLGARYTRYADDLTFSFAEPPAAGLGRIAWWIDQICGHEGFRENAAKRRFLRPSNRQQVTGVVVNQGLHVPREVRRRLRAILHNCRRDGLAAQARGRENLAAWLRGWAAYVKMVEPARGARLQEEVEEVVRRG